MVLFENDIYICGLIIGFITLILIWINNKRRIQGSTPDIKIRHHPTKGTFPRRLNFQLQNKGLGLAKNIDVKNKSEIGDFEPTGYEKELLFRDFADISLVWKVDPIPTHYEGTVKVKVRYESIFKIFIFFKDKKTHTIKYHIKDGKVTLLEDGN